MKRWRLNLAAAICLALVVAVAPLGATHRSTHLVASTTGSPAAGVADGVDAAAPNATGGASAASAPGALAGDAHPVARAGSQAGLAPGAVTYDEGADDREVRVGGSTFTSGPAAVYGQQVAVGFAAGANYVNDHGGINGRRMVAKIYDDAADPAKVLSNTKRLVEVDHVFALSMITAAISGQYVAQKGIPVVLEGQLDEDFTNPWWFPLGGPQLTAGMQLANYGARTLGVKKVAIFYLDAGANNFSGAFAQKLAGYWKAYGVQIGPLVPFAPDQTSCSSAISAAKSAGVDFVDFEIDAGHVVECGVEAQIQGYKPAKSWGGYLIGVPVIPEALGDYSVGMLAFDAFGADYDSDAYQAEVKKVSSSTDTDSSVTIAAFVSALVLADGMRQLGTQFTRAHLRDVLNGFANWTPKLTTDPNQPSWTWTPPCHLALSGGYVIKVVKTGSGPPHWVQASPELRTTPLPPGQSRPAQFGGCSGFVPG